MTAHDRPEASGAYDSPESALGFLLNQAGGVLREHTAAALAPLGMSPRTFGALLAITERPGISQTELSRRLRIDRTTMSQLVDDLTHRKLIKRTVDPDDRRNHQLTMTSSGSRTLSRAVTAAAEVERQLTAHLPAGRLAAVKEGLRQLLDSAPTTGPVCRDD